MPKNAIHLILRLSLVSRVKGIVEVDAGQDRKHVGLQERDQNFEGVNCDRQRQWRDAADSTDCAE